MYDNYYAYYYKSTSAETRGFAVYNLDDLAQWSGVNVFSGEIWVRNEYRSYATEIEFYSMDTIPYDGAPSGTGQACFEDAGGAGTAKLATPT